MILFQSSAEVTAWPERIGLTFVFLLILGLLYLAMYRNWHRKALRDNDVPRPLRIQDRKALQRYEGRYIATTYADDWLKRVHAFTLSFPSNAELIYFSDGIGFALANSDIFIPVEDIVSVQSTNALAGKVFEADGLIALTWKLGDVLVVTGFRAKTAVDHVDILARGERVG